MPQPCTLLSAQFGTLRFWTQTFQYGVYSPNHGQERTGRKPLRFGSLFLAPGLRCLIACFFCLSLPVTHAQFVNNFHQRLLASREFGYLTPLKCRAPVPVTYIFPTALLVPAVSKWRSECISTNVSQERSPFITGLYLDTEAQFYRYLAAYQRLLIACIVLTSRTCCCKS